MKGETLADLIIYGVLFVIAFGAGIPIAKAIYRAAVWYWGKIPI